METKTDYFLKLSLKELASRRVVVNLWNESDILSAIANLRFKSIDDTNGRNLFREAVGVKVKDKLMAIVVPETLKKQMFNLVKPIGSEIRAWKRYHEIYISNLCEEFEVSILKKLHWTSLGTIDFRNTAKEIVRCEMGDLVNRYILACLYCLEDYIPSIWEELPEETKNTFYDKEGNSLLQPPFLPYIWPYILKGELSKLTSMPGRTISKDTSFYLFGFQVASRDGNKAAIEYFLNKINIGERESCLVPVAHLVVLNTNLELFENPPDSVMGKHTEVLCYLLSLMTPEQQLECFKAHPVKFFRCFLEWPWHEIFTKIASLLWTFIRVEQYDDLLECMTSAVFKSDCFIPELFQEIFVSSPVNFKKKILHESIYFDIFSPCLLEDSKTIQVIFENIDADDRMKLVNTYYFYRLFQKFIQLDQWHFVELCLREATLSKENKEKLKKTYIDFMNIEDGLPIEPEEYERFFRILDKSNASVSNKRSLEDETQTQAKIVCSENK